MLFNSPEFLYVFLPIALILYLLTNRNNYILLFVSLVFYVSSGVGPFLLLISVIFINYVFVRLISSRKNKAILTIGVLANLSVLGYYKYSGFVVSDVLNVQTGASWIEPILPIGISFYIFQCISLLVDQFRSDNNEDLSFQNVASYITMFPQLIAGPIVRFDTVRDALNTRNITRASVIAGWLIFSAGLAQKVLIADNVAQYVDTVFALDPNNLYVSTAWIGIAAYTIQIYFDFAGYSNMAIGIGLWLGFKFPSNFNFPYASRSITEFWRRWHMSLSSWFRDYLYIPLGGNRKGKINTYRNLILVFLICGFWHGASWNFVIWGMFHGFFLTIERMLKIPERLNKFKIISTFYCVLTVLHGWVLFRAPNLDFALAYYKAMYSFSGTEVAYLSNLTLFVIICGAIISTGVLSKIYDVDQHQPKNLLGPAKILLSMSYFIISSIFILSGSYSAFIYFQF